MWLLVYWQSDSSVGITGTVKTIDFYNQQGKKVQSDQISSSFLHQKETNSLLVQDQTLFQDLPFKRFNLIGQTPRLQCPVSVRAVELSSKLGYTVQAISFFIWSLRLTTTHNAAENHIHSICLTDMKADYCVDPA